jgi:hypothetical protein
MKADQPEKSVEPEKFVHLIAGTPDEDCPICRAHGLGLSKSADKGSQGNGGCSNADFVEELTLIDILRCPCPMCSAARKEVFERS